MSLATSRFTFGASSLIYSELCLDCWEATRDYLDAGCAIFSLGWFILYSDSYFWLTLSWETFLDCWVTGIYSSFWLTIECWVDLRSTKIGPGFPACFGLTVIFWVGLGGFFIKGFPPVPRFLWGGSTPSALAWALSSFNRFKNCLTWYWITRIDLPWRSSRIVWKNCWVCSNFSIAISFSKCFFCKYPRRYFWIIWAELNRFSRIIFGPTRRNLIRRQLCWILRQACSRSCEIMMNHCLILYMRHRLCILTAACASFVFNVWIAISVSTCDSSYFGEKSSSCSFFVIVIPISS